MFLRQVTRKLAAVAALFALLVANVPALADSLSVSSLPACCNTVYCPLHRGQSHDFQKDKSNCDPMGNPVRNDSSMRACDTAPGPVVGTAPYVLPAPFAMLGPASSEPARIQASQFFPFVVNIPLTPPPRALQS